MSGENQLAIETRWMDIGRELQGRPACVWFVPWSEGQYSNLIQEASLFWPLYWCTDSTFLLLTHNWLIFVLTICYVNDITEHFEMTV